MALMFKFRGLIYQLCCAAVVLFFGAIVISAPTAYAAGAETDITAEARTAVDDHQSYYWLQSCFYNVDMDKVTEDEVTSWEWFSRSIASELHPSLGGYFDPARISCSDGSRLKDAFQRFGFATDGDTNAVAVFCDLGFTYSKLNNKTDSPTECRQAFGQTNNSYDGQGGADANQRDDLNALLQSRFPSKYANSRNLDSKYAYVRQYLLFKAACNPTSVGVTASGFSPSSTQVSIPIVTLDKNTVTNYTFNLGNGATTATMTDLVANEARAYTSNDDDVATRISCGALANDMARSAGAYQKYLNSKPDSTEVDQTDTTNPGTPETTTQCNIDGLGWVVCPALRFIGELNERAFSAIAGFLTFEDQLLERNGATEKVWSSFRDIANVAFVIVFLIIIYSQLTSVGISNYGIKRMLPKLIIAAVLVNSSYILCQLAVDISNIVGAQIYSLFHNIPVTTRGGDPSELPGWLDVTGTILAGGLLLAAAIFLLSTLGVAALLALMLVVLILIGRKAILILLIVVAPLAFVAYLLPNTEQWFKKWWALFSKLLMLFPVVGAIFGASYLAARIINAAGTTVSESGAGTEDHVTLQITALGVAAIPLFAVPFALKGAAAATGAIGAMVAGGLGKNIAGARDQGKDRLARQAKSLEGRVANNNKKGFLGKAGRYAGGFRNRRAFRRDSQEAETTRNQAEALTRHMDAHPNSYSDSERARGVSMRQKISQERVDESKALLFDGDPETLVKRATDQLKKANAEGDITAARAATQILSQSTGSKGISELNKTLSDIESSDNVNSDVFGAVRSDISSAGIKGKDRALDRWSRQELGADSTIAQHTADLNTARSLNEAELAGQSANQLQHFADNGSMSQEQAQRVLSAHSRGAIPLDDAKLKVFRERAAATEVRNVNEAHGQATEINIQHNQDQARLQDSLRQAEANNPSRDRNS